MDQNNIALGPFVSKMLLFYKLVLRESFASLQEDDRRQIADLHFFVRTDTGHELSTKDVTAAVKRSCKQFVDGDREITSLGMRHSFATHWFHRFKEGRTPAHLQSVDQFLDWLAAKMNTGREVLKNYYISSRVIVPTTGTRLVTYPPELDNA